MYSYNIELLSVDTNHCFKFSATEKATFDEFLNFLFNVFEIKIIEEKPTLEIIQLKTPEIEKKIIHLVDSYKSDIPQIHGLSAFFRTLKINQPFAFLPNLKLDFKESMKIHDILRAHQKGITYDKLPYKTIDLFGTILDKYKVKSFGSTRIFIGNKYNKVCRFCNGLSNPKKYTTKAHSISEALGNKKVFLHDECNFCNHKFSKTIEPDIIEYLSIFRTIFKIKGKGGIKQFRGKNFDLVNENDEIKIAIKNYEKLPVENTYNRELTLESHNKVNVQNIYKALCKYFLSVIDSSELKNFKQTVNWINGSLEIRKLPKVAKSINTKGFNEQPILNCYLRTNQDKSLPYAVVELLFANLRFIYIIPGSKNDNKKFIWKKHFTHYWESFKHLHRGETYAFEDFSNNSSRDFIINLNFSTGST